MCCFRSMVAASYPTAAALAARPAGETGGLPWLGAEAPRRGGTARKRKRPSREPDGRLGRRGALYRLPAFRRSSSGSLAKFTAMRRGRGAKQMWP